jgi:hypothetical protein
MTAFQFETLLLIGLALLHSIFAESLQLSATNSSAGLELSWAATVQRDDGSFARPFFELQWTFDFQKWEPVGQRQRTPAGNARSSLNATIDLDQARGFYRLSIVQPDDVTKLGSGGAEVFGYHEAFAQQLQMMGQISIDQFAAMYPPSRDLSV